MRRVSLIAALISSACSLNNPGEAPPRAKLYFPTAVAVADDHLLVANANFDVRYNAGSLQAYDLSVLNEQIDACLADPLSAGCDCRPYRPCIIANTGDLLADNAEVLIDSFASGIAFSPERGRVYIPTRSNGGLTFVDFAAGVLTCAAGQRRCSAANVAGVESSQQPGLTMPNHPSSVAVGALSELGVGETGGQFVLVGDQDGALSLFVDRDDRPELQYVRRGLPGEVTEIALGDGAAFLSTDPNVNEARAKTISQIGFVSQESQGFLASYVASALQLAEFGGRGSVRSLAFSPGSTTDLVAVTLSPNALVRVDLARPRRVSNELRADSVVSLGSGPSKVQVGTVGTDPRVFAFVSCFDSREIMIVDVELRRLVSVVQGLTGPFSLALDTPRSRLYVGDFRSSTIRVVDLAPLVVTPEPIALDGSEAPSPRVIAVLGRPSETQALQ